MNGKKIKDYTTVILGCLFLAIAFNATILPLEIIIGGSSGLSIIGDHFFEIAPSLTIFICYISALIFGVIFLGKEEMKKSIIGSLLFPLFVYITSPLCTYVETLSLQTSEYLVVVIIGAVVTGIAHGMIYKVGYTAGGSDIASKIINKYFGITVGSAGAMINTLIVASGGVIFGWDKVLYAVLTLYVIGKVTDKVLLGISYSKKFYIITSKDEEVKEYIFQEFNKTVTEIEAIGGYSNLADEVLMCVVPTRSYFKLKEGIEIIDKDAFIIITDAYELENKV
ncbi:MAG TPA: YitT family protein [Mollicutes bacterium]|nr:YitT family protein [Mollicutes bacterium]